MPILSRSSGALRWILAIFAAIGALVTYYCNKQQNPVTGEVQHIRITKEQEIALGLQAAPEMASQFGGEVEDPKIREEVNAVGQDVLRESFAGKSDYKFEFHVLRDPNTVNAFALPGGQVFITMGLLKLLKTKGQLAGVLGHEVGHVIGRHGAEHMAKAELTEGLTGAAVMATYDPNDPSTQRTAQVAMLIGQMVNMKFGRDDELESDNWGVKMMAEAGYDPHAMIGVMEILAKAGGGQGSPEFFSTHPNPENRIARIQEAIEKEFPKGLPQGLEE